MATIGIIIGSIREGRLGESVGKWVADAAAKRAGADYKVLDLKEFNVPLLDAAQVPGAANKQYDNENVTRWSQAIDECDGYIFVTPEYNHSVPGAMKNAFDALGPEWAGKVVAFVGYGSVGAVRAVEHWRTIVSNFQMVDVRNQIDLSMFTEFDDQGNVTPDERRGEELENILNETERLVHQLGK
ncbi:NADPH-dependent FMN reductase [Corynebacterium cystitidis]|uniref:NADPH-dependent FMN reductase n=1 Tax=Corynebacterium cystitidis TaxID=35757 RepID=UPI00211DB3FA|nr:NAD(P)H-dependent oxidoreductase [Corynebacterium cystitidis]